MGDDAELIAALPRLLREDPDAGVRLAALKRLNEYEHWRERSTGDSDDSLRRNARAAYLGLLCAQGAAPTIQRRIAELDTLAPDELERVAIQAAATDANCAARRWSVSVAKACWPIVSWPIRIRNCAWSFLNALPMPICWSASQSARVRPTRTSAGARANAATPCAYRRVTPQ